MARVEEKAPATFTNTVNIQGAATLDSTVTVGSTLGVVGAVTAAAGLTATTGNLTSTAGNVVVTEALKGIVHTGTGAVTQGTNITTGVTINSSSGIITLHATAITADTNIEFTVTNSHAKTTSVILLSMQDENTVDNTQLVCASHTHGNGSFKVTVANTDSAQDSSATAVKVHFLIVNPS